MSAETHEYVHELLEEDPPVLVIEEESAGDLQGMLNEPHRHGYDDVAGITVAGAPRTPPGAGVLELTWRYVAVVRKSE